MAHSKEELGTAVEDVIYLADQMFSFYLWEERLRPVMPATTPQFCLQTIHNAVLEAQLMFYRKVDEFFRPKNQHHDDLKSQLYGYPPTGGFLDDAVRVELHKRAAHPTLRQASHGKAAYDLYQMTHGALGQLLPFLTFLSAQCLPEEAPNSKALLDCIARLRMLWDEWSLSRGPSHRLFLKV